MNLLLVVFIFTFCLFPASLPAQEVYRWVDEKGSVYFTDNFDSIPEKYRSKAEKRRLPTSVLRQPQTSQSLPSPQSQLVVVPFTRDGNAIIVQALVNGTGTSEFILDPGASLTIIPADQAQKLGINPEGGDPVPLSGVGGTVMVPMVKIDSLDLGGAEVRELNVAIHPGFRNRGLLGMDFLSEFRIEINHVQNRLTLEYQPCPHDGHSLQWWQQKFRFWHTLKESFQKMHASAGSQSGREVAEKLLREVNERINDLEIRASRAGVPRELRQ
jgi:clan AA aspartic protease (TIGR02281 family)